MREARLRATTCVINEGKGITYKRIKLQVTQIKLTGHAMGRLNPLTLHLFTCLPGSSHALVGGCRWQVTLRVVFRQVNYGTLLWWAFFFYFFVCCWEDNGLVLRVQGICFWLCMECYWETVCFYNVFCDFDIWFWFMLCSMFYDYWAYDKRVIIE